MITFQCLRQRRHADAGGQRVERRQLGVEAAIDQYQAVGVEFERAGGQALGRELGVRGQGEITLGNSTYVSVLPRLVAPSRETDRREARRAGLAPRRHPARIVLATRVQTLEKAFRCTHATDSSSTQS